MYQTLQPLAAHEPVSLSFENRLPLVLDADGTLLRTNLLAEGAVRLVRRNPLLVAWLFLWLLKGRAYLKQQVAARTTLAVDLLPVSEPLVAHAVAAHAQGRTVVLATAAGADIAHQVAARFPFISETLCSTPTCNLKGAAKAAALVDRFPAGFVYAGDSRADLPVWRRATLTIFAGRSQSLSARLARSGLVEAAFTTPAATLGTWRRALRVHQWAKNALIFVPMMLAGHFLDAHAAVRCVVTFLAFGMIASATYLLNDLMDLEDDRRHWTKRHRPLASGVIGIGEGCAAAVALLVGGIALAATCGLQVVALVIAYCIGTIGYSFHLKRVPVLDVAVLAGLFTLRLVVGAAAAQVPATRWLLVFSMFLFLSLGFAKRLTELTRLAARSAGTPSAVSLPGRGYVLADVALVQMIGGSSAITSVLILVLYLVYEAFPGGVYAHPDLLWGVPMIVGLWLGRIWLLCGRGELADDPVVFATRDRISLLLGLGALASFVGAVVLP